MKMMRTNHAFLGTFIRKLEMSDSLINHSFESDLFNESGDSVHKTSLYLFMNQSDLVSSE